MMVGRLLSFWHGNLFKGSGYVKLPGSIYSTIHRYLLLKGSFYITNPKQCTIKKGNQKKHNNHTNHTLQGTNISPKNVILKMIFLFPRWDMLIPWRVHLAFFVAPEFSGKKTHQCHSTQSGTMMGNTKPHRLIRCYFLGVEVTFPGGGPLNSHEQNGWHRKFYTCGPQADRYKWSLGIPISGVMGPYDAFCTATCLKRNFVQGTFEYLGLGPPFPKEHQLQNMIQV